MTTSIMVSSTIKNINRLSPQERHSVDSHHGMATPKRPSNKTRLPAGYAPGRFSVICGRGKLCSASPGNLYLRFLIRNQYLASYSAAQNKAQKSAIVSAIISHIREVSPIGAFVKGEDSGEWWEVDDSFAREKIGCIFRDILHTQYRSSTKSKQARKKKHVAGNADVFFVGKTAGKKKATRGTQGDHQHQWNSTENELASGTKVQQDLLSAPNQMCLQNKQEEMEGVTPVGCKSNVTHISQDSEESTSLDPLPLTTIPFSNYYFTSGEQRNNNVPKGKSACQHQQQHTHRFSWCGHMSTSASTITKKATGGCDSSSFDTFVCRHMPAHTVTLDKHWSTNFSHHHHPSYFQSSNSDDPTSLRTKTISLLEQAVGLIVTTEQGNMEEQDVITSRCNCAYGLKDNEEDFFPDDICNVFDDVE